MPHVYDYTYGDGTPAKYNNPISTSKPSITGTWVNYGTATSGEDNKSCEIDIINGQLLYSKSQMTNQKSCVPHSYNAGNYYNLPSRLGEAKFNNVCPKGWSLPDNNGNTSYSNFLIAYGVDYNASNRNNQDATLLNLPLSFLRSGSYSSGSLGSQGSYGFYRMTSLRLRFASVDLSPASTTYADEGYPVRCVSR